MDKFYLLNFLDKVILITIIEELALDSFEVATTRAHHAPSTHVRITHHPSLVKGRSVEIIVLLIRLLLISTSRILSLLLKWLLDCNHFLRSILDLLIV
jgi:hypothetical protein